MEGHSTPGPISSGELPQLEDSYRADVLKRRSEAAKQREAELEQIKKVSDKYAPPLLEALGREPEAEVMKRELEALTKERDAKKREKRAKELRGKHGKTMKRVLAASGIDKKAAQRELLAAIGHSKGGPDLAEPTTASLANVEFVDSDSLGFDLVTRPQPMPSPPPAPRRIIEPPYPWTFTETDGGDARALPETGQLWSDGSTEWAGSYQTLAAVGDAFTVPSGIRRVRVLVTIYRVYLAWADAIGGYASAEATVNFILRDDAGEVKRTSEIDHRSVAVAFWMSSADILDKNTSLMCEFERSSPQGEATFYPIIELETWVGAGGVAFANAWEAAWRLSPLSIQEFVAYLYDS
jgi:hypothetical protein